MTMRDFLIRGMLVGVLAAVVAFGFASIVGEPQIVSSIAFEEAGHAAEAHDMAGMAAEAPELVSRPIQSTIGLATGLLMLGVAYGGIFAIAFALVSGRIRGLGVRGTALLVALATFVALYLIPFLKYPANPPAVGDPDTIVSRTELYFGMMLVGVIVTVGFFVLRQQLLERRWAWTDTLMSAALVAVLLVFAYVVLPEVNEVPEDFPAAVLWRFRVASIGMQLSIWLTMGLAFGALTERAAHALARPARATAA